MPHNAPDQIPGWNSYAPIFATLIERVKPRVIIEVGSWQGASAIHMAKLAGPECVVWCVDTFEGSQEHQSGELPRDGSGKSRLLELFDRNVQAAGVGDRIAAFQMTSARGADFFMAGITSGLTDHADLIYIDGSHQYPDVVADLAAYWPLLRPGGIMFGDDYIEWRGNVDRAVNEFPHAKAVIDGNHWYMEKPL